MLADEREAIVVKKRILRTGNWDQLTRVGEQVESRRPRVRDDLFELVPEPIWKSRQRALGATEDQAEDCWTDSQDFWGTQYISVTENQRRYIKAELPIVGGSRQSASRVLTAGQNTRRASRAEAQDMLLDNVGLLTGGVAVQGIAGDTDGDDDFAAGGGRQLH